MHTLWKILAGIAILFAGLGVLVVVIFVFPLTGLLFSYFFGPTIDYKYGLIDRQGKFVVKPDFVYITALTLADTYVGFKDDPDSSDSYDGFQYSIDKNGNIDRAYKVSEDFYPSNNDNGLNKFGLNDVDTDNSMPDKYLQPVQQNGKYGYKNRKGEWIIQPKWNNVTNFEQNIAFVFDEDDSGGKWGLINAKGKELLKPVCVDVWPFHKGLARCKVRFVNGKYN